MARTLLFLSADTFHASIWHGGKLGAPQHFSNDANGREQFSLFLKHQRSPAYLLVDVIEEDFRIETIPHLIGPAKRDLLERKFEQFYRGTPFRQATLLHRLEEGRRDDEMLFSALTNPQRISPWIDILHTNQIPLVGIYSLPNISTPLLKQISEDHVLLLSWEKEAGLRQTYFNNKRLHFSRLIPINNSSTFSQAVATETPRTQQYLKSLSLPPPGETLSVYVICHASDRIELQSHLEANSELRYNYLDIQELGKHAKAKFDLVSSDATPLILHLLAAAPPKANYAHAEHTHFYTLCQLRRLLFVTAGAILSAAAIWSGLSIMQGHQYIDETEPVRSQTERIQQQTQQIQHSFGNTTVPAADMKTAVLMARQLNQYSPPPQDILRELSLVMDKFDRVTLNKLAWQTSPADAAPSPYPAQLITFDGSLSGFGSDFRRALDYLERFRQALEQRGYTVRAEKLPLDVSSKGSISGDLQASNGPAQFTLKIIWRQKP